MATDMHACPALLYLKPLDACYENVDHWGWKTYLGQQAYADVSVPREMADLAL